RQLLITVNEIQFILVKGSDVPIYVEQGVADIGIVGSDILEEGNYVINNLLDLPFGECHFALAAKPDTHTFNNVATTFIDTKLQKDTNLKSNGLVEKDHIKNVNAKLITNKASYFKKSSEIDDLIKTLEVSLIDYK